MGYKQFSDMSGLAVSDTTKFLREGSTTNSFEYSLATELITYISGKGYKTQTEIEALTSLVKTADFTLDESIIWRNGSGTVENKLISAIDFPYPKLAKHGFGFTLSSTQIVVAEGRYYNEHFAGITKLLSGTFAKGTGNGGCATSPLIDNDNNFVFLIKETATDDLDIFIDNSPTCANCPGGWTNEFQIGMFYTGSSATIITNNFHQLEDIITYGVHGRPMPNDYINEPQITLTTTSISVRSLFCRDAQDDYNLVQAGTNTLNYPTGLGSASSKYYIYATSLSGDSIGISVSTTSTGLGASWRKLGTFYTDENAYIIVSTLTEYIEDKKDIVVVSFNMPLSGITDTDLVLIGEERTVVSGQTSGYTTDFAVSGWHVGLIINSLTGNDDIVITGTSKDPGTGVLTAADTENITINATGTYRTQKNWLEVTNILIGGSITAIDYDIIVCGCESGLGNNFTILGYSCTLRSQGVNPDIRIILKKMAADATTKLVTETILEDIGIDSGATGNQIVDHLRTGGDDRSYNPAVTDIWGDGETFSLEQHDFNDYFTSGENEIAGSVGEGFKILLDGEPDTGGISNVDYIIFNLFVQKDKVVI